MNRWRLIGLSLGLGVVAVMVMLFGIRGTATAVDHTEFVYLPVIQKPVPPPTIPTDTLKNGSFENGWDTIELGNQDPNDWFLSWVPIGQPLYDATDTASGICECVHKLSNQLPPNEQLGGPDALILDGSTTYKMFSANASFGVQLTQTITNLPPGTSWRLIAPVLVVVYDNGEEPYSAESGAWVLYQDGDQEEKLGQWTNWIDMGGSRSWHEHVVEFTVPTSGEVEVMIRVKSKWPLPKDFFIDNIRLEHLP